MVEVGLGGLGVAEGGGKVGEVVCRGAEGEQPAAGSGELTGCRK